MDRMMGLFQGDLVSNLGYTDDQVIDSAVVCETELKRSHLIPPPPPPDAAEYPTRPFGLYVPPSVEQQIGRPMLESPTQLLRGRRSTALRHDSRLSISIPPDGGPVIVESLDIPAAPTSPSGPRLPSVVSIDSERNSPPDGFSSSETTGREKKTVIPTAHERRTAFAKTRTARNVPNGITDATSGFPSNGKSAGETSEPITSARQKRIDAQKNRGGEYGEASDSAAPQAYDVSVRL